jgi:hypothetical protein
MRSHNANELNDTVSIIDGDGLTVLASGVRAGISDLAGRSLEQAQLRAVTTTHMILIRAGDASTLTTDSYLLCPDTGLLYLVDYTVDPRKPRQKMWLEVYCHLERSGN